MRTIQLFSAAFNMNNKKIGRNVMQQAEELDLIPNDQNGSRKNRRSVLIALNKVIIIDISQQMRQPITITSNDDQSYYDCIVLWIVSLALQRIGLSQEAVFSMTNTLQFATHDINTMFGISIEKNFPTDPPNQGSRQGNGAGSIIWVMISAILLTIMRDNGYGLDAISCLTQLALIIAGFAFVDDTDIINAAKLVNTKRGDILAQQ